MENESSSIIKIESEYIEPNFSIFENGVWTDSIKYLNKHNNDLQQLYKDFKQNQMEYEQRAKLLDIPNENIFSYLSNLLCDNMMTYIIIYILMPTTLIISLIFLICICIRKF